MLSPYVETLHTDTKKLKLRGYLFNITQPISNGFETITYALC